MAVVHSMYTDLDSQAAATRAVGSSIRLAQPIMHATNYLLGYAMQGNLAWSPNSRAPVAEASDLVATYAHRHPNCDRVMVWVYTGEAKDENPSAARVLIRAGTGDEITIGGASSAAVERRWLHASAPWGSADSGPCPIEIEGVDVGIQNVVIDECPRLHLDISLHSCIETYDSAHVLGGLREGRAIIESNEAGPLAMITASAAAWKYGCRQGPVWIGSRPVEVDADVWTDPFTACPFGDFRARQQKSETTRDYDVYVWCWSDASTTFEWRVSSDTDVVTSAPLSHTSPAWTGSPVSGLAIKTSSDDTPVFEMRRTNGVGIIYVQGVAVLPEVA